MSNEFEFPPPKPEDAAGAPFDSMAKFFNQPLGSGVRPASPGARFWASVLEGLLFIVTLGIGWFIWSVFTWQKGQSPAKSLVGLTVVDSRTNATASFGQMIVREVVGKFVLGSVTGGVTGLIGAAMVLTPKRQALWDLIASTTVIKR